MRRQAIICCVALLTASLAVPALEAQKTAEGAEAVNPRDLDEFGEMFVEGVRLRNEDLPVNVRLSILTSFLVSAVKQDSEAAHRFIKDAGLDLDGESLTALADIYGDFNERLAERQRTEMAGLDDEPELRAAVSRQLANDLYSHGGETLGRWLGQLRVEGHDVASFLSNLLNNPRHSMSVGGSGDMTLEELESDAALFGESFEREFGSVPEALLAAN